MTDKQHYEIIVFKNHITQFKTAPIRYMYLARELVELLNAKFPTNEGYSIVCVLVQSTEQSMSIDFD